MRRRAEGGMKDFDMRPSIARLRLAEDRRGDQLKETEAVVPKLRGKSKREAWMR